MYLVKHQLVNNSKYGFHMFSELLTTNNYMNSAFSRIFIISFVCWFAIVVKKFGKIRNLFFVNTWGERFKGFLLCYQFSLKLYFYLTSSNDSNFNLTKYYLVRIYRKWFLNVFNPICKLKDLKNTSRKIFWEGHKNFKESSTLGDNFWAKTQFKSYAEILFLSSSDFLKIPLVFSEHLNIIIVIHIFGSIQCPLLLLFSDLKWSMKLFTVWHLPFQFYISAFFMLQMGKFYGTWIR